MVNGRFYSVESIPLQFPYKPLRSVLETTPTCRAIFPLCRRHRPLAVSQGAQSRRPATAGTVLLISFRKVPWPFPDRPDLPARTMLTSEGSVSRSTHVVADPRTQRLRTLTSIECERLNGFPDDWTAGMPERLRYFTMGNALVVPLVKAMGSGSAHWPRTSSAVDGRFSWVSKGAAAPLWHTTLPAKSSVLHLRFRGKHLLWGRRRRGEGGGGFPPPTWGEPMVYVLPSCRSSAPRPVLVALFVVSSKNISCKGYASHSFCSIIFS